MYWQRYSPPQRGGVAAHQENAAQPPLKAQTGWSAPNNVSRTNIYQNDHPSAPVRWLRILLLMAQPPLLSQEGNTLSCSAFTPSDFGGLK